MPSTQTPAGEVPFAETAVPLGPTGNETTAPFVDRRESDGGGQPARERRQFTNSHDELSPAAAELARAIDEYKVTSRRRFIDFEEMMTVIKSLGYTRQA